jgi:polar amino acid transport system substrate-binding protein
MKRLVLLLSCLCLATGVHAQEVLTLNTESYPPFTYREPDGTYKGAGIDQVARIMLSARLAYSLDMMPWARAFALAETKEWNCAFAAARTPERERRFKWVTPLYIDRSILVRHTGSDITASTIDEAKSFNLGTHREDYTEQLLKNLGFPKIDISADFDATLRKLLSDRIDMMPMSEGVFLTMRAKGVPIEKVVILSEAQLGIACNRNIPDDVIARMQTALDDLIKDGTQRSIEAAYGIKRFD